MARQSAPVCTAWAPSCASASGWVPYTYCHAHTCSPPALSVATSSGENCCQAFVPSELLTNTVEIPCDRAWAMIACRSPPLDFDTYQIHIPLPSNAPLPPEDAGVDDGVGRTTRHAFFTRFERRPARSRT